MTTPKINKAIAKKNGTAAKKNRTGAMGRPKFIFDEQEVKIFGVFSATFETMAEFYGVSIDTIRSRMQDEKSDFSKAYKRGNGMGLMKLREAQFNKALKGDSTMLIWLGKQLLGQHDKSHNSLEFNQPIKLIVDETDLDA